MAADSRRVVSKSPLIWESHFSGSATELQATGRSFWSEWHPKKTYKHWQLGPSRKQRSLSAGRIYQLAQNLQQAPQGSKVNLSQIFKENLYCERQQNTQKKEMLRNGDDRKLWKTTRTKANPSRDRLFRSLKKNPRTHSFPPCLLSLCLSPISKPNVLHIYLIYCPSRH